MSITGRHPSLLTKDQAVILVVDVQESFLKAIPDSSRLIDNLGILLNAGAILEVPVVSTTQNRAKLGAPLAAPSLGAAAQFEAIDKLCFSCAGTPAVLEALKRLGRRQIVLCGVEAHICINQTAHDLMHLGYEVHVVADAVGSRKETHRDLALRRMENAGAVITTVESALYEMLGEAGSPEFKAILQLVR